jgi:hypothetical protein
MSWRERASAVTRVIAGGGGGMWRCRSLVRSGLC